MSKDKKIFDLEECLGDCAVRIIRTVESLPKQGREIISEHFSRNRAMDTE